MRLRNHTPHTLVLFLDTENTLTLHPDEPPARCEVERHVVGRICVGPGHIPVTEARLVRAGADLPPPEPDTLRVVSRIVAEAHPRRGDLVFPDDLVRDHTGQVIGCKSLSRTQTSR